VLWFLRTIEDVLRCSLFCLCTSAGGGTSQCCCSVHLHCSGGTELVDFLAVGFVYYRAICVGLVKDNIRLDCKFIVYLVV
jgi:hypothetical protein